MRLAAAAALAAVAAALGALGALPAAGAVPAGFRVVEAVPAGGSSGADGARPVVVRLSGVPSPGSPRPQISPPIAGSWSESGASFVFTPSGAFAPGTQVTVRVPGGRRGVVDRAGHRLARSYSTRFEVGLGATVRAEQILAQLGYLPVTWRPAERGPLSAYALAKAAFEPPAGSFVWDWAAPPELRSLFSPGRPSVVLRGAVMAFQAKLGLPVSGELDLATWTTLLAAARRPPAFVDRLGYSYALVSEASPESFTLWHDGRVAVRSPANTGIGLAPTSLGTFPVYLRFETQVMKGKEPDGSPYADPVSWVAYFVGGEAVHYIGRAAYGYPQSLGCVELPWQPAAEAWPLLGIGTLVTVVP